VNRLLLLNLNVLAYWLGDCVLQLAQLVFDGLNLLTYFELLVVVLLNFFLGLVDPNQVESNVPLHLDSEILVRELR
jgi:hypothetical protein